jgi:NFU1 iron-sulfur cluster scaffold homolog, mitochondrial
MLSSLTKASGVRTALQRQVRLPLVNQIRTMFIQTEDTPNPESLKFLPGRPVLETTDEVSGFYAIKSDTEAIARSPLSKTLFKVEGVKSVYLGADFVTITKYAEHNWVHVKGRVFSAIMDHYASGKPAVSEMAEVTDTTIFEDDDEVVAMIKELLETRIRPAVQEDGGDIRYIGFAPETGVVTVQLAGSCVGCPSSAVTLKQGVENMLMHYIPEVTEVHSLEEVADEGQPPSNDDESTDLGNKQQKTYEERLAAAGIPFSD